MDQNQVREKNRAAIEAFLQCRGPKRGEMRAPLFAENATQEIAMPGPDGFQYRSLPAKEWLESTAISFPEWGFYDNMIFETEDPNIFLVKSRGQGFMVKNGKSSPVEHFYVNEFRMKDGKIEMFRENPNPSEEYNPYTDKESDTLQ